MTTPNGSFHVETGRTNQPGHVTKMGYVADGQPTRGWYSASRKDSLLAGNARSSTTERENDAALTGSYGLGAVMRRRSSTCVAAPRHNTTPGPKPPVEHALMPRCSFPEAVARGIAQKDLGRMSLMRDEADRYRKVYAIL